MTQRSLVTLLLLAALVPVTVFGVENWRGSREPGPAPAGPPARAVRAALGRSAYPGALGVRTAWSAASEPSRTTRGHQAPRAIPPAAGRPPGASAAGLGAGLDTTLAMIAGGGPAPDPRRWPEAPRVWGGAGLPSRASAVKGAAWGAPAVVEFAAIMQDQQVLLGEDFWGPAVRELQITVGWNVPGSHTQQLDLFTPDGALYRRFGAAFDGDAARFAGQGGRTAVETRLPVGGTWITEYSLFGAWRVDVYLGGQPTPVTSASFVLNP